MYNHKKKYEAKEDSNWQQEAKEVREKKQKHKLCFVLLYICISHPLPFAVVHNEQRCFDVCIYVCVCIYVNR